MTVLVEGHGLEPLGVNSQSSPQTLESHFELARWAEGAV